MVRCFQRCSDVFCDRSYECFQEIYGYKAVTLTNTWKTVFNSTHYRKFIEQYPSFEDKNVITQHTQ